MLACFAAAGVHNIVPIHVVPQAEFPAWLAKQAKPISQWLREVQFRPEPGSYNLISDNEGKISRGICCVANPNDFWSVGNLAMNLPLGNYQLDIPAADYHRFALAWGLGAYQFSRYKNPKRQPACLVLPRDCDQSYIMNHVETIYKVRDWINTPTDNMGPSELAEVVVSVAKPYKASVTQIIGDDLLRQNFACIHTVGRASDDAPRLVDLRWGKSSHPKVTLVGKGVCFDTGGLDLKDARGMALMKKDMAGAAHVLGLAQMIMQAGLPIQLRVLMPLVENAVSGNAYRPGDIIKSRKGLTVEIGNTDAEGRLVLADALAEAVSDKPDLLIDIATLTGAARVALGPDLPALFTNNDKLADALIQCGIQESDPMWRLPLFPLYREYLNSHIADINNCSTEGYAGAITAALFLKEFVPDTIPWAHFDLMAWNIRSRPGRPLGGEAMALRAIFGFLKNKYKIYNC